MRAWLLFATTSAGAVDAAVHLFKTQAEVERQVRVPPPLSLTNSPIVRKFVRALRNLDRVVSWRMVLEDGQKLREDTPR